MHRNFRTVLAVTGILTGLFITSSYINTLVKAQEEAAPVKVADATEELLLGKPHPIDPAIKLAMEGRGRCSNEIADYTATLVRRERVNGELKDHEYIYTKVRNRAVKDGKQIPFSCYMYFLKPGAVKGRELIYVEGQNGGKFCVHEGGAKAILPNLWLAPDGALAMKGQRYPLTKFGIQNLIDQMIERAQKDRKHTECKVTFRKEAMINKRKCTLIQVQHPTRRAHFDFHVAQIFIDDELKLPVRYAAYDWPAQEGARPQLLEEYTYVNIDVNVGLVNMDFDPENPNYNFNKKNK
jgi:hypothetical protein